MQSPEPNKLFQNIDCLHKEVDKFKEIYANELDNNDNVQQLSDLKILISSLKKSVDEIHEKLHNIDNIDNKANVPKFGLKLVDLSKLLANENSQPLNNSILIISDSESEASPKKIKEKSTKKLESKEKSTNKLETRKSRRNISENNKSENHNKFKKIKEAHKEKTKKIVTTDKQEKSNKYNKAEDEEIIATIEKPSTSEKTVLNGIKINDEALTEKNDEALTEKSNKHNEAEDEEIIPTIEKQSTSEKTVLNGIENNDEALTDEALEKSPNRCEFEHANVDKSSKIEEKLPTIVDPEIISDEIELQKDQENNDEIIRAEKTTLSDNVIEDISPNNDLEINEVTLKPPSNSTISSCNKSIDNKSDDEISNDKCITETNPSSVDANNSTSSPFKSILKSSNKLDESLTSPIKKVQFIEPTKSNDKLLLNEISDSDNSICNDADADSSDEASSSVKGLTKRIKKHKNKLKIKSNVSVGDDAKLSAVCYVSVLRVPAHKLKDLYERNELRSEDAEIKRLCNMDSLKRTKRAKKDGSSSDESIKTKKKVVKRVHEKKNLLKGSKLEKLCTDSSDSDNEPINNKSEKVIENGIKQDKVSLNEKIAELEQSELYAVLPSDHSSHSSDSDKETNHKDPKNKEKNNEKSKNGSDNEVSNQSDNEKDKSSDEDSKKNVKKESKTSNSNWKNDKALITEISDSSEDELKKFSKKKDSKFKDGNNAQEHKKKVPKMIIRRLKKKKVLLSDSDDESGKENNKKDSSGEESEEKASSSDSEEEEPEEDKKSRKRRIKRVKDSSSDEDEKTTRKQIRKVWTNKSLAETTVQAERAESERKNRISERQKKYNNIFEADKLEKATLDKVVLDFNDETEEELLTVHKKICKQLKPHQGKGVQFMWNACFESIDRATNTPGSGCILAHCMGLGKTLQVITLIHTILGSEKTGVSKVLVVCPLSTVLNWVSEFKKWLPDDDVVEVFDLVTSKQLHERQYQLTEWHRVGGVMVIGYDMFRNLTNDTSKRITKRMKNAFQTALIDPGPDLVVCDEGHLLKNEKTSISIQMNKMKTLRRIVLTGTPLQNNLKEYFCMVQFVKPNLLGTYKEYLNRFVNPITNGQYTDSTQHDIQIMRKRSHVLHKLLDGLVQRKDYSVLAPFLPPKYEYVLFISLTETQINLYSHYMREFARKNVPGTRTSFLFIDFQELQRICTHPRVLLDKSNKTRIEREKKDLDDDEDEDSEGSIKDFLNDGSDDAASTPANSSSDGDKSGSDEEAAGKKTRFTRRTRATAKQAKENGEPEPELEVLDEAKIIPREWWGQYTQADELDNIKHSGKLFLLFDILHQCELMGDKVLVFSQSLFSLSVIEYFLNVIDDASQNNDTSMVGGFSGSWSLGLDYFRLDGSSSCENRAAWCKTFNDPKNTRARLFLISTRAGGLGINLVAANRVIIFDVSWNPSHDIQSIYRVYRFGQNKPSYVYRFVTNGTMEMKIYERQVTKQAISKRVIDEQQIDRHYNQHDLAELYKFDPKPENRPIPLVPKDILLGELLQKHEDLIYTYHEHQTLLENKVDEVLDEAERKAAWDEFENEKKQRQYSGSINNIPMNSIIAAFKSIVKRERPTMTDAEINGVTPQLIAELQSQLDVGDSTIYNKILQEVREMQEYYNKNKLQEMYRVQQQQQALAMFQQYQQQMMTNPAEAAKFMAHWQSALAGGGGMGGMGMPQGRAPMSSAASGVGGANKPKPSTSKRKNTTQPTEIVELDD